MYTVAALYKFVALPDYVQLREELYELCHAQGIIGTLLLAEEGINGTVAGSREAIDALNAYFQADERFHHLEYKESAATLQPFRKLRVRLKKEIVTIGLPEVKPTEQVGEYIEPEDWNDLISDPDVVLLDTRNEYETRVGTFEGAIDPHTETFRQFPDYVKENFDPKKHKKVAMFCTGGIRCEKASSYMKQQGFENVYHLKGGILKYLENIPEAQSKWEGECFVFDRRVGIKHGLEEGEFEQCWACGNPLSPEDRQSEQYVAEVSCPWCYEEE